MGFFLISVLSFVSLSFVCVYVSTLLNNGANVIAPHVALLSFGAFSFSFFDFE
jgi:hypothetical protein